MTTALIFASGLGLLGLLTGFVQVRGLHGLRERRHIPSDEYQYLQGRYRRRLLTAVVMFAIGGMIAGAYLSGMERRADQLGEPRNGEPLDPAAPKPEMNPEQKQFVRLWGLYWIGVIVLVFAMFGLAMADVWASRRYWLGQMRQLREDHNTKLRRDLAVVRSQNQGRGNGRFGGRLGGGAQTSE